MIQYRSIDRMTSREGQFDLNGTDSNWTRTGPRPSAGFALHLWPWIAIVSTAAVLGGMLFAPGMTATL